MSAIYAANANGIGDRIRAARHACGYSQTTLASIMGATHSQIWAWETGVHLPEIATVLRLCHALNIEPNRLLGWDKMIEAPPSAL